MKTDTEFSIELKKFLVRVQVMGIQGEQQVEEGKIDRQKQIGEWEKNTEYFTQQLMLKIQNQILNKGIGGILSYQNDTLT